MKNKILIFFILLLIFAPLKSYAQQTYDITLKSGENLVVLPATPKNTDIKVVLSGIMNKVKDVWEFNPNDSTDPWKHFRPGLEEYSDLKQMSSGKGYWINLKSDAVLQITGETQPQSPEADLKQGWNQIVWPYESSLAITTALSGLTFGKDYDQISTFNNTTKTQENFLNQAETDTLTKFDPDRVYYIHMLNQKKIGLVDPAKIISWDIIAPSGTIEINNRAKYTNSTLVSLSLSAEDNFGGSGVYQMRFYNHGTSYPEFNVDTGWSAPESYVTTKTLTLPAGDGEKLVRVKFSDLANNWSIVALDSIVLITTPPNISKVFPEDSATFYENEKVFICAEVGRYFPPYEFQFFIDGVLKHTSSGDDNRCSFYWTAGLGKHKVKITVKDAGGEDTQEREIYVYKKPIAPPE